MKKKLTNEEKLKLDAQYFLNMIKEDHSNTFWQPRLNEIIPIYKEYFKEHPDSIDNVLQAFAWHSFKYALQQR